MNNLTSQLESFFVNESEGDTSIASETTVASEDESNASDKSFAETNKANSIEDKQKLLSVVKNNVDQIKNNIGDLLNNTWAAKIADIQKQKRKIEIARTEKTANKD